MFVKVESDQAGWKRSHDEFCSAYHLPRGPGVGRV